VHVRDNADAFKQLGQRFNALWTPTILVVDSMARSGIASKDSCRWTTFWLSSRSASALRVRTRPFSEAEPLFRRVSEQHPNTEAAAEALYWAGVSR
jgi:hypothetical protein